MTLFDRTRTYARIRCSALARYDRDSAQYAVLQTCKDLIRKRSSGRIAIRLLLATIEVRFKASSRSGKVRSLLCPT